MNNLFSDLPQSLPEELVETLVNHQQVRIERIVSTGHSSPPDFWYDQDEDEWVIVLKGAAKIKFAANSQTKNMKPGDYLFIPAHQKHRVELTSATEPTVWLAVFIKNEATK